MNKSLTGLSILSVFCASLSYQSPPPANALQQPRTEGLRKSSPHMLVGSTVIIHGLSSRADLNGRKACVIGWDVASGKRWMVKVEHTGEKVKTKQANLRSNLLASNETPNAPLGPLGSEPDPHDPRWCITSMLFQGLGSVPGATEQQREGFLEALEVLVKRYGRDGEVMNVIMHCPNPVTHLVHAITRVALDDNVVQRHLDGYSEGAVQQGLDSYSEREDLWATRFVRTLLQAPAIDINLLSAAGPTDPAGMTPLFAAAQLGLPHVTRALLEYDAIDPSVPCAFPGSSRANGRRALGYAAMLSGRRGQPDAARPHFIEVIKALVAHPRCDPSLVESPAGVHTYSKVRGHRHDANIDAACLAPDLTALDFATTHEAASVIKQAIHQRALCAACGAGGASMRCVKCECVCYCSAICQQVVCK